MWDVLTGLVQTEEIQYIRVAIKFEHMNIGENRENMGAPAKLCLAIGIQEGE